MSNKIKVKKHSEVPEGNLMLSLIHTKRGMEILLHTDEFLEPAEWGYLLAGVAQAMAHKLDVDVDILYSLAFVCKKSISDTSIPCKAGEDVQDFTKTVKWNDELTN